MATTTYAFNADTGQTLVNDTTAGAQQLPSVVTTADGGAAVFYLSGTSVEGRLLDSNGSPVGPETLLSGTAAVSAQPKAARLANGDFVVAWTDSSTNRVDFEVLAPDLTPITAILHASGFANNDTSPSVTGLTDGSFIVSYVLTLDGGQQKVIERSRFTPTGSAIFQDHFVESTPDNTTQLENPSVTGLSDGGYAVAYDLRTNATGVTVMKSAVFNANNTVRSAPSVFDSVGTTNMLADASSLPNGGFVVDYEDSEYSGHTDTSTAFFNAAGTLQNLKSATNASGSDIYLVPAGATSPDGFLFTAQVDVVGSLNNAGSLIAPDGTVLTTAENIDAFTGKSTADVTWLDGSHVLLAETSLTGSMLATGVDPSGNAVDSVVFDIVRNTSGDSATPLDFSGDGIDNIVNLGSGNDTVFGGQGSNYIVGNGGDDELIGGAGINTIYAFGGNDYLQGGTGSPSDVLVATGAGNDTFYGGSGNNYIVGGTGKNTIVGGGGALQSLYGNGSNGDYIVGGSSATASNVLVENGAGGASLWGGLAGSNYEVGGAGDDLVVGGNNSDYLFGGAGNDTLYGGNGTDYIYPGPGNDFIWTDNIGSQSTDYVYEGVGTGVDTVADFTPGDGATHDVLVLTAASSAITSFADVQAKAFQAGIYTVLPLSNTDQIYLYNVATFQLTANDFIFV